MEFQEEILKDEEVKKFARFEFGIFGKMIICSIIGIFSFLFHLNGMVGLRFY